MKFNSFVTAAVVGMLSLGIMEVQASPAATILQRAEWLRSAMSSNRKTVPTKLVAGKWLPERAPEPAPKPAPVPVPVPAPAFNYASQKVRGVNLGGWLVLEPWITPSIFEANGLKSPMVDEYTLCQGLGKTEALKRLTSHWNSWITLSDFQQIKNHGMNHVRIPIGYWAVSLLPGDPYVQGQLKYLDQAVSWAKQVGLKVWVDLHGAPGSQNGFDNSGRRGSIQWQSTPGYVDHTVNVIGMLSQRYATLQYADTVAAIELLNEPLGPNLDMGGVKAYWQNGYKQLHAKATNPSVTCVIHDAFQPTQSWNGFMNYGNVVLDIHRYQVFSPGELQMSEQQHINTACGVGWDVKGADKPTVVGEWSGALTDCAKYLNGYDTGARYEGQFAGSPTIGQCGGRSSGSVANLPQAQKDSMRRYIEAQLDAYEQGAGWIFWTWKTQGAPEWDMRELLAQGIFPNPGNSADRKWPNQCGF